MAQFFAKIKEKEDRRISALPIRDRCRELQLVLNELGKAPRIQKEGTSYPVVDDVANWSQLTRLKSLLDSMEFSPALQAFLNERTVALADDILKENPPANLRAAWMNTNGKQPEDLKNFVARQSKIFSGGPNDINFIASTVNVMRLNWDIRGSFNTSAAGEELMESNEVSANLKRMKNYSVPQIILNEKMLGGNTVLKAYESAFHEQIHSILWQLGLAFDHKVITETHPLYNDAALICERMKYGVEYVPHYIPAGYYTDPLEKACLNAETLFAKRCGGSASGGLSGTVQKLWNSLFSPGR